MFSSGPVLCPVLEFSELCVPNFVNFFFVFMSSLGLYSLFVYITMFAKNTSESMFKSSFFYFRLLGNFFFPALCIIAVSLCVKFFDVLIFSSPTFWFNFGFLCFSFRLPWLGMKLIKLFIKLRDQDQMLLPSVQPNPGISQDLTRCQNSFEQWNKIVDYCKFGCVF